MLLRYIKPNETLESNKLKDGASILVMRTREPSAAPSAVEAPAVDLTAAKKEEEERVERVLQAAEALAKRDDDGTGEKYYLELTDQNGKPFPISGDDRHAILLGLALHEKGRKNLKEDEPNYEKALEYLLAADKAFNRVNPTILSGFDNPGFLSLDIAWCYFMQQRLEMLKDAAWRLGKASDFFDASYGPMQERLITLKGGACPEMVVYVRLYLLEAIVSFHSGNKERAAQYLIQAECKLVEMALDPKDLKAMEDLGFTPKEARIALRAANKNVNTAVEYAMNARERIKENKEAERLRRQERATQRRYGRCADGQSWVDTTLLQGLTEMGFEQSLVAEALRQSNNVQHVALGLLTEHTHLLRDVVSEQYKPPQDLVEQVIGFGFTEEEARKSLRLMVGDVQRAVNYLLYKSGVDVDGAEEFAEILAQVETEQDQVGGYSDSEEADDEEDAKDEMNEYELERDRELKQAEHDLVGDIQDDPDAHLDLTLEAEAKFLLQYKSYLAWANKKLWAKFYSHVPDTNVSAKYTLIRPLQPNLLIGSALVLLW